MIVITFLRNLVGYVCFRAYGGFADRFLNLCTSENISLWNIQNVGGRITACTYIKDYLRIRKAAKKSGMRVMCVEKRGLPFFIRQNKKRAGLFVGIAASLIAVFMLSQFTWSISVVGNTTLENEYILEIFEKYGIKVGTKITKEEIEYAVDMAMKEIETLSWAAVNKKGSVAVIEVREKTQAPQMYDASKPTNLVASEDGVVLSVDVLYGKEEVKPGSAVTKGDLLIGGVVTHRDGTESLIHADGYVKALVRKNGSFSYNDFTYYSLTDSDSRKVIFFFGIKIPLGKVAVYDFRTEHKSFAESDKNLLPLGIITEYSASFSTEKTDLSDSVKNKTALFGCALSSKNMLEYCDIKNGVVEKTDTGYLFYAECEQEIGKLQEIYVEKDNDTE